jgi:ComF family protein
MSSPVNLEHMRRPWAGLRAAFDRLWPAHCLVCGERAGNGDLCAACLRELPWNRCACPRCGLPLPLLPSAAPAAVCGRCQRRPPPLTETRAVFRYASPLDRLLPRLKFHRDLAAGRACALRMADALASAPRPDALVPLPLHRARLRERGFDQALELTRPLAKALDLPLLDHALVRVRDTAPQSRLDAPARRRNLRRAFAVPPGITLPAHVALVDDVMTTGATLHAAADTLVRAGVTRVDAWVCARVA